MARGTTTQGGKRYEAKDRTQNKAQGQSGKGHQTEGNFAANAASRVGGLGGLGTRGACRLGHITKVPFEQTFKVRRLCVVGIIKRHIVRGGDARNTSLFMTQIFLAPQKQLPYALSRASGAPLEGAAT